MGSMSYCAFENTLGDLQQCNEILSNGGPNSVTEIRCALKMIELCKAISEENDMDDLRDKLKVAQGE